MEKVAKDRNVWKAFSEVTRRIRQKGKEEEEVLQLDVLLLMLQIMFIKNPISMEQMKTATDNSSQRAIDTELKRNPS